MATLTIKLPEKLLDVTDRKGGPTGDRVNVVVNLMRLLIENVPAKNETDTMLAMSIGEKLDKMTPDSTELRLEEPERFYLQECLKWAYSKEMVRGSNWYHLVVALREATKDANDAPGAP